MRKHAAVDCPYRESETWGTLVVHIGRVVRDPKRGYCFIEDTEGGEKAFLHVSKTVEHSLDNYHRGSYVEFDPQPGPKGIEAHNARLLSGDELAERGISNDAESSAQEQTVAEDVDGLASGPMNDKHFLFANAEDYPGVFVMQREFLEGEPVNEVIAGSKLRFDVVMTTQGPQARRVRVVGQPELVGPKQYFVKDWPWHYGFLNAIGHVRSDVLVDGSYLRPGDVVDVWTLPGSQAPIRIQRTGWRDTGLSVYERDLDMGDPTVWIPALAGLAEPERWDVDGKYESRILRNYLKYTYIRQQELDNLKVVGNRMGWNTGLVDRSGDDIVAVFAEHAEEEAPGPRWRWTGFMSTAEREATDWRDVHRATWWEDPSDLVYDISKGAPTVQSEHIAGERDDRFPKHMQEWPQADLVRAVQEAARDAVKRVAQNYKTAIPQFYRPASGKGAGSVQLLLPLRFPGQERPSLALAVRRDGDSYYGATVLKIEWAYTYARLLTRPDTEWLDPFTKAT